MKNRSKEIVFWIVSLFLVFLIVEGMIRIGSAYSKQLQAYASGEPDKPVIHVEGFGNWPTPLHPEHDKLGFRNQTIINEPHFIAYGDSQTYGVSVSSENTWPMHLNRLSQKSVYNMAWAGWNPLHGLMLMEKETRFRPRVILQAVYTGNDFYEIQEMVRSNPEQDSVSLPELLVTDKSHAEKISRVSKLTWEHVWGPQENKEKKTPDEESKATGQKKTGSKRVEEPFRLKKFLDDLLSNSATYRFARSIVMIGKNIVYGSGAPQDDYEENLKDSKWPFFYDRAKNPPDEIGMQIINTKKYKTVLECKYRDLVIDQSYEKNRQGMALIKKVLEKQKDISIKRNVDFAVVLIPTRELVFEDFIRQGKNIHPSCFQLLQHEKLVIEELKKFTEKNNISMIDATPYLVDSLRKGQKPYYIYWDGHPASDGNEAIARAVMNSLESAHN